MSSSEDEPHPQPLGHVSMPDPEVREGPRLPDMTHSELVQAVRDRLNKAKMQSVMQPQGKASDSDDEPPGLISEREGTAWLPEDSAPLLPMKALLHSSGLLSIKMAEQGAAALDACPTVFTGSAEKEPTTEEEVEEEEAKKEEEKKEDEMHVGHIVAPDGQGKDAGDKKGSDGDPSITM